MARRPRSQLINEAVPCASQRLPVHSTGWNRADKLTCSSNSSQQLGTLAAKTHTPWPRPQSDLRNVESAWLSPSRSTTFSPWISHLTHVSASPETATEICGLYHSAPKQEGRSRPVTVFANSWTAPQIGAGTWPGCTPTPAAPPQGREQRSLPPNSCSRLTS